MKFTKKIFVFAAAAMLLTGCGGGSGGNTGTKTSKEEFHAKMDQVPSKHPYVRATLKHYQEASGQVIVDETKNYTYDAEVESWVDSEGSYNFPLPNLKDFIYVIESKESFDSITYYLNPFGAEIVQSEDLGGGNKYEVINKASFNDYGLCTYASTKASAAGQSMFETYEVTYESDQQQEDSQQGGTSGQGQQEVDPNRFLELFKTGHGYKTATMSIITTVEAGGQKQTQTDVDHFVYDEELGWTADGTTHYMPLESCTAKGFVGSFIEAGATGKGYEIKCYTNPYRAIVTYGTSISIDMIYDEYGLPQAIVQTQDSGQYTVRADVVVNYSK